MQRGRKEENKTKHPRTLDNTKRCTVHIIDSTDTIEAGLLGKMADSTAWAGNVQDEPGSLCNAKK